MRPLLAAVLIQACGGDSPYSNFLPKDWPEHWHIEALDLETGLHDLGLWLAANSRNKRWNQM